MRQSGGKPTYYIWKSKDMKDEDIDRQKMYWKSMGFRPVVFTDGDCSKDINIAVKAIIQNHIGTI